MMNELSDQLAVRNLIAKVALAADEGDLAGYGSVWCDDARWVMDMPAPGSDRPVAPQLGREAIVAAVAKRISRGFAGRESQTRHAVSTSLVEIDGDAGRATSYVTWYRDVRTAPQVALFAVYEDEFRRTAEGWKFAARVVRPG